MAARVGVCDGVGVKICVGAGTGWGAGTIVGGSGMGCCEGAVSIGGEMGGPTFVVITTATGIGESACPVTLVGFADEASTMRAVVA
jgi:hypothetical protein